jgi:hypothetical protein
VSDAGRCRHDILDSCVRHCRSRSRQEEEIFARSVGVGFTDDSLSSTIIRPDSKPNSQRNLHHVKHRKVLKLKLTRPRIADNMQMIRQQPLFEQTKQCWESLYTRESGISVPDVSGYGKKEERNIPFSWRDHQMHRGLMDGG